MGTISSAPTFGQPTPAMCSFCLQLLMLHSAVLVKGPVQGSLNHEGSVMSLGAQNPRYLQTTEPAWQMGHSLPPSRAAGDKLLPRGTD